MLHFDIDAVQRGYALNKMFYSLNNAENRAALAADEDGYCDRYGLSAQERAAVKARDREALFALGGNMYFVAKLDRVARPAAGGR